MKNERITLDLDSCGSLFMSGWRFCPKRISQGLFLMLIFVLALSGSAQAGSIDPGSTVTVSVSSGPGNKGDWVGLFRVGAAEDGFNTLEWCFLSGTHDYPSAGMSLAKFSFVLPKNLNAGQYEFRFYASDNYFRRLATGNPFTVGSGGTGAPKITATPMQIEPGSSVAISVSGGSGINDWVGLYRVGAPSDEANLISWSYLNGTQNAPPRGTNAATFTLLLPKDTAKLSAGQYELRLFANDDFKEPLADTKMLTLGAGAQLRSAP